MSQSGETVCVCVCGKHPMCTQRPSPVVEQLRSSSESQIKKKRERETEGKKEREGEKRQRDRKRGKERIDRGIERGRERKKEQEEDCLSITEVLRGYCPGTNTHQRVGNGTNTHAVDYPSDP